MLRQAAVLEVGMTSREKFLVLTSRLDCARKAAQVREAKKTMKDLGEKKKRRFWVRPAV